MIFDLHVVVKLFPYFFLLRKKKAGESKAPPDLPGSPRGTQITGSYRAFHLETFFQGKSPQPDLEAPIGPAECWNYCGQ
jgi:hypothetical protein